MKTFKNDAEYKDARMKLDANSNAHLEYCKANKTNGIPVEICDTFPFADEVDNDMRSAVEVWEFVHDIPEKYFLYISEEKKEATTWTGQKLGSVSFGNTFRSNMGDKRTSVRINAINGKMYSGTYFNSAGSYARVKLMKS